MERVGVAVASVTDSVENEQAASARRLVVESRFLATRKPFKWHGEKYLVLYNQRETDHIYGNFLDSQGGDRCTDPGGGLSKETPMDETTERLDLDKKRGKRSVCRTSRSWSFHWSVAIRCPSK